MATTHPTRAASLRAVSRAPISRLRSALAPLRGALKGIAGAGLTVATVLVLVLVPDAVQAYAPYMIGTLRSPGEPGFIAGHRGDRSAAPENTLPAFEAAFATGMEFVETDVQLTADGYPVLLHDPTVDRTTDGTGAIADLTLAQVEALDAGSWFGADFAGTRIPQLGEFLDLLAANPQKKALIELKDFWTREEVRSVLDEIFVRGVQNRVVFASFHFATIENLGHEAAAIPRIIIRRDLPADPVGLATFYGAIAIMTSPRSLETYPDAVADMHAAGFGVIVYTLNSEKRWNEAMRSGVDGMVTDEPSELDDWIAATAPGT